MVSETKKEKNLPKFKTKTYCSKEKEKKKKEKKRKGGNVSNVTRGNSYIPDYFTHLIKFQYRINHAETEFHKVECRGKENLCSRILNYIFSFFSFFFSFFSFTFLTILDAMTNFKTRFLKILDRLEISAMDA